jgi:predicted enzyme related to lactoylglutathione lyase
MSAYPLSDPIGAGGNAGPRPVVHLELHTRCLSDAREFYVSLFDWRSEQIATDRGSYLALGLGSIDGGIVECGAERPLWLPYVEVDRIVPVTERARALGATVMLEPREGPAGWRSVIATDDGGEVALWQRKELR